MSIAFVVSAKRELRAYYKPVRIFQVLYPRLNEQFYLDDNH